MLTVKQTAERLNVSQNTIYSLISNGKIPCHRIGLGRGAIRIAEADLAEFLQQSLVVCERTPVRRRSPMKHLKL